MLWKGQWVRVDPAEMPKLASLVGTTGTLTGVEALATALAGQRGMPELGDVEVVADSPLSTQPHLVVCPRPWRATGSAS